MLLDLLFTPKCIGCQRLGVHLCEGCFKLIHPTSFVIPSPKLNVMSAGTYEGWLRESIVRYKSGSRSEVFGLAQLAAKNLPRGSRIVPVPTSLEKVRERGFDTVGLLARQISRCRQDTTVLPVLNVRRLVQDQVGLTASARRLNVAHAFGSTKPVIGNFVVLDDVVTTGSTVQECARALKSAGANEVFVFSLCSSANRGYL